MYTKENQGLKFQFILGNDRKHPGSSVFWAALQALRQTPSASPSPNVVLKNVITILPNKVYCS